MSFEPVIIRLAGTPMAKGRPRFSSATGHAYTPKKTESYESALRYVAQQAMGSRPPLTCALRIDVTAYMPIPRSWSKRKIEQARDGLIRPTTKPDRDNILKMIDALNEVVWRDDQQGVEGETSKFYSDTPGLVIKVSPLLGVAA